MSEIVLLYKMPVYVTVDPAQEKVVAVECYEAEVEPFNAGEVPCLTDVASAEARAAAAIANDAHWPHVLLLTQHPRAQHARRQIALGSN